jgi:hypothetical protein
MPTEVDLGRRVLLLDILVELGQDLAVLVLIFNVRRDLQRPEDETGAVGLARIDLLRAVPFDGVVCGELRRSPQRGAPECRGLPARW